LAPAHPEAWGTLSPDWGRIAYLKAEPSPDARDATYHIYVADFDGTNEYALPGEAGASTYLVWSPDGQWIDYTVMLPPGGPKNERAYLVRSDGSAAPVQIAEQGAASGWSPDSTLLVVHDSETQQVYTYDVNSGRTLPVWDGIVYSHAWSRDGSRLAFVAPAPGQARADLHVFDLAARSTTTITEAPTYAATPQWSPDGDRVAFMAIGGGFGFGYCE
jgi:TolB protein